VDIAGEESRLRLRLALAAHGAIGKLPPVPQFGKSGAQRVRRLAAGFERIGRARVEREGAAAVLHDDPRTWQHAAGAELEIERLDIGDGEPRAVRGAEPDRIALAR